MTQVSDVAHGPLVNTNSSQIVIPYLLNSDVVFHLNKEVHFCFIKLGIYSVELKITEYGIALYLLINIDHLSIEQTTQSLDPLFVLFILYDTTRSYDHAITYKTNIKVVRL